MKKSLWPKIAILCYHRVEDYTCDPAKITVSNENFFKQMQYLKKNTNIIHPDQFFDLLKNGISLPKRSILLTFDDGYSSYEQTMNLLYDESISAIFFISSSKERYWWDTLSSILLQNRSVNDENFKIINSLISYLGFDFKIERNIDYNSMDTLSNWITTDKNYPFNRNKAFYFIADKIEHVDYLEQKKIIRIVSSLSNKKRNFYYFSNKKLINYHRIGFHTVNHPNLSKLGYEDQKKEIELGKKNFESLIKRQIDIFAYPFGTTKEAGTQEFELASRCGFSQAVTTRAETIRNPDPYAIPRLGVPNYLTLNGFIGKLSGWECLIRKLKF